METTTTAAESNASRRPRWRKPLIIIACLTLYSGCDTYLGPGLVMGTYDRTRYAVITSQLRVGESKAEAIRAFHIGLTEPSPVTADYPGEKPGIEAMFVPFHMICFAEERYLRVAIDQTGRVESWTTHDSADGC